MSQKTHGIYRLTQIPYLYESFQRALGAARSRQKFVSEYVRPRDGERYLDLGCGSAAILPYLGAVTYVGIDLNPEHISQARAIHGERGQFHSGDFASLSDRMGGTFDVVLCLGLLHHLDDGRVRELGHLARAYLAPTGRLITIDPVFAEGQHWIARNLAASDSGQCVRTAAEYRALLAPAFGTCDIHVRHDLLRIPYSHCITVAKRDVPATPAP